MAVVLAFEHPPLKRAIFAVAGLAAIVFPVWDMAPAFSSLTLVAPFFAVIVIGAFAVGAAFLHSAILGDDSLLSAEDSRIVWTRKNLLRSRTDILAPADIAAVGVRRTKWDTRADSWYVTVTTRSGFEISSGEFMKREAAERLRDEFAGMAGLA